MKKPLIVCKERIIDASPAEVWKVITTPDYFDEWMYVPGKILDKAKFSLGSIINWMNDQGIIYMTGEVIKFMPAKTLVISIQDISWKNKVPKGTVTYEFHLTPTNKGTKIKSHLGDLSVDPEGQLWYDAYNSSDEIEAIYKLIQLNRRKGK